MKLCPNCKLPIEDKHDFCVFCGINVSSSCEVVTERKSGAVKKCKNGHEFDDADLVVCPVCGLSFNETIPSDGHTWKCSCGNNNPEHSNFCDTCGSPKVPREKSHSPVAPHGPGELPEGGYIPTDKDIIRKNRNKV